MGKINAIMSYKIPENKKDIETFLGMATQLSKYICKLSTISEALRMRLKKNVIFQ